MSLLRTCSQAIPRRALPAYTRCFSAETPSQPVQTRDSSQKESTQIAEPLHADVLTAEVISGAPGVLQPTDNDEKMPY
jgi:NADH dehydrogenase (ubiquinone) Fe-S protein 4